MAREDVARIYYDIRKDVCLYLQYNFGCSPEDALDAMQTAVLTLLDKYRYDNLDEDGVERRLRMLAKRAVDHTYRTNDRAKTNEQSYLDGETRRIRRTTHTTLPGGGRQK